MYNQNKELALWNREGKKYLDPCFFTWTREKMNILSFNNLHASYHVLVCNAITIIDKFKEVETSIV